MYPNNFCNQDMMLSVKQGISRLKCQLHRKALIQHVCKETSKYRKTVKFQAQIGIA